MTRYGDVLELVAESDGAFAILNGGDALELRFPASQLPPPAPGHVRTFFFYSWGGTRTATTTWWAETASRRCRWSRAPATIGASVTTRAGCRSTGRHASRRRTPVPPRERPRRSAVNPSPHRILGNATLHPARLGGLRLAILTLSGAARRRVARMRRSPQLAGGLEDTPRSTRRHRLGRRDPRPAVRHDAGTPSGTRCSMRTGAGLPPASSRC